MLNKDEYARTVENLLLRFILAVKICCALVLSYSANDHSYTYSPVNLYFRNMKLKLIGRRVSVLYE